MGNPLDLPGPQFLVFYSVPAVVTLGLLYVCPHGRRVAGRRRASTRAIRTCSRYLRGGKNEALRVATVLSLVDRGLLVVDEANRRWPRRRASHAPRPDRARKRC